MVVRFFQVSQTPSQLGQFLAAKQEQEEAEAGGEEHLERENFCDDPYHLGYDWVEVKDGDSLSVGPPNTSFLDHARI